LPVSIFAYLIMSDSLYSYCWPRIYTI